MKTSHIAAISLLAMACVALGADELYRLKRAHKLHDDRHRYERVAVGDWTAEFVASKASLSCDTEMFNTTVSRKEHGAEWYMVVLRPKGQAVATHPMGVPSPPKSTCYMDLNGDGILDAMVDTAHTTHILLGNTWVQVKEFDGQWIRTRSAQNSDGKTKYCFTKGRWGDATEEEAQPKNLSDKK
jgi:hypothetical protein